MKRYIDLLLFLAFTLANPLQASDAEPQNIRLNVTIEKQGYEERGLDRTNFTEKSQQFLTTLEGHEASLFVGRRVPIATPIRRYLVENQYLEYAVHLTDVGTKLLVRPRLRGDHVEVEVTPEISYEMASGDVQAIRVDKLSSTVMVPNGQTIQLGSSATQSEFFDAFYRTERGERLVIFLTPETME